MRNNRQALVPTGATRLRDIADELGLSTSTVSRALTGFPDVDERTRSRVRAAAARVDYQPNSLAKSLRQSQTRTVGIVLPDLVNSYYSISAAVAVTVLAEAGYDVRLSISTDQQTVESNGLRQLLRHRVDGILVTPAAEVNPLATWTQPRPLVVELNRSSTPPVFDAVVPDDEAGAYEMTKYLLSLGHREIGFAGGPSHLSTTRNRARGFVRGLRSAGLKPGPLMVYKGQYSSESGRAAITHLLNLPTRPTAILAGGSLIALGALQQLRDDGLRVPDDISIACIGDPEWLDVAAPRVTAYALPLRDTGLMAAHRLLELMSGTSSARLRKPTINRIPGSLLVRESTARLR